MMPTWVMHPNRSKMVEIALEVLPFALRRVPSRPLTSGWKPDFSQSRVEEILRDAA